MQLSPVPERVAHAGLCALRAIALADGELSPLEAAFLESIQTNVLHSHVDLTTLEPIAPDELARAIPPGEMRERLLCGAVVMSCIDGKITEDEVSVLEAFARALALDLAPVRTARRLAREHLLLARIDIARRALAGHKLRQTLREDGVIALVKQLASLFGATNDAVAARYRSLEQFPAGTLGREYFDFISGNGFSFPGEQGAAPEIIVVHDCLHVIGGYGTSASEEIDVSSFQAGCHSGDPLYGLLFGLAQYHLGVQVSPVAKGEQLNADPQRMMRAFARGTELTRDMWSDFRPWDHFDRPLDALRAELGLRSEK
jgi:tellurite resistance protein